MEFQKSERNQQIHEQRKLERQERGRTRPKMPAPRFVPGTYIPEVPEGMELHKFYGKPILLPAIEEGEPIFDGSRYSVRQAEILFNLEKERRGRERISLKHQGLF
ncbi:hypothetical protein HYT18_00880 [Candidatus Microgenomates bacterium]|nr:hypothetical protein [Candidatus Microgenomates bacterium]